MGWRYTAISIERRRQVAGPDATPAEGWKAVPWGEPRPEGWLVEALRAAPRDDSPTEGRPAAPSDQPSRLDELVDHLAHRLADGWEPVGLLPSIFRVHEGLLNWWDRVGRPFPGFDWEGWISPVPRGADPIPLRPGEVTSFLVVFRQPGWDAPHLNEVERRVLLALVAPSRAARRGNSEARRPSKTGDAAEQLGISLAEVRAHLETAMTKLGARDALETLNLAHKWRQISLLPARKEAPH